MELYQILENIAKITYQIQIIYIRLTFLEVSKDIEENYAAKKKEYLEELFFLKQEEDEAYKPLEEDYTVATSAIEIINHLQGNEVSEKMEYCQKRITNRLQQIAFNAGMAESSTDLMESFIEEEFFATLFLDKGYSKEDLLALIESLYPNVNTSISNQFIGSIDLALKDPNNFDIRRLLINLKFDYLFQKGSDIELRNLTNSFNPLSLSVSDELNKIKVPSKLKQDYLDAKVKEIIIYNLIPIFGAVTDEEMALEELIWFKTYLLYLSSEALLEVKNYIESYTFNYSKIKDILLKHIGDLDKIKKEHNNSKNYTI